MHIFLCSLGRHSSMLFTSIQGYKYMSHFFFGFAAITCACLSVACVTIVTRTRKTPHCICTLTVITAVMTIGCTFINI